MKKIQTINSIKTPLAVALAAILSACGGTGQDEGSASNIDRTYSGLVVDGYVARALIFLDSNNNGTRDSWESFAFTDDQGYYSYNPITDTNYCAPSATPEQAQYCLRTDTDYRNVVVRIDGGYDVLTGEPFAGQLSRRVDSSNLDDTVITPVSTLLTNLENEQQRDGVLTSLGLEASDLDIDYLDEGAIVNSELLNINLKVHKVVTLLDDRLTDTYTEIGEDFGTPNDASNAVYDALADELLATGSSIDDALSNPDVLVAVMDDAEQEIRQVYEDRDFDLPPDMGSLAAPGEFERVAAVAANIPEVIDVLIDPEDSNPNEQTVAGGVRALEVVVTIALEEEGQSTNLDNAIEFITTEDEMLVDALVGGLSEEIFDIPSLVNNDFSGNDFDSVEEISGASSLGGDVSAFTQIGGLQLRISDIDLGLPPNNLNDKEFEIYFNGAADDVSGSFEACVKYIEGASSDGTLGEANTRGELISGYWSLLGANEENVESFSLLMTISFLGATYQAIMKPAGFETINQIEYERIRFDNDGEIRSWYSEDGLVDLESIPTTNSECEARLPSRVNI